MRRAAPAEAAFTQWRAPDGWAYRRMDWLQPAGRMARGNLLFAGGRGDFIEKYLEIYAWWHVRGWNLTALDWRGQGHSRGDIAGGNLLDFDILVDDLSALVAQWREEQSGPHAAVGHSMGGHILLKTLIEKKPRLDAAVLVAPMIRVNSAPLSSFFAPFITDLMCTIGWRNEPVWTASVDQLMAGSRRQKILTSSPERYADELWWWEQEPGFHIGAPSWGWMRAAYRSQAASFTPEKLRTIALPVLLLGTDRDRLVSLQAIREAAELMPRAQLHVYADAGHEILREVDAVRLDALARIGAFLDEHASAQPRDA